jgi:hypothetical protein
VYGKDFYTCSRELADRQKSLKLDSALKTHFFLKVMDICAFFSGAMSAWISSLYSSEYSPSRNDGGIVAMYILSGYFVGTILFRTTSMIFHVAVTSCFAIITESPKSVYLHNHKLLETLSTECPGKLADIHLNLYAKSPPGYYDAPFPYKTGWSVNLKSSQKNSKDIWALVLYILLLTVYLFCVGILWSIESNNSKRDISTFFG